MRTSDQGIALLHHFEGCRLEAYPDPGTGGTEYDAAELVAAGARQRWLQLWPRN